MAREALPPQYLKAGEEYLEALQALGLDPEFLGWGQELDSRLWVLVLVTSVVEIGGPLTLNRLLFRAYTLNATPKEISPFIVRVFGSRTIFAPGLVQVGAVRPGSKAHKVNKITKKPEGEPITVESFGQDVAGMHLESRDSYVIRPRKRRYEQRVNEWTRFKHNVERLAA